MRNISFMLTTKQIVDRTKDVTRRDGWLFVKEGELLCAVEKSQGLGKGGKVNRLGVIRVKSVRREKLRAMTDRWKYGLEECRREGFPDMTPAQFVTMFCRSHNRMTPRKFVTRIEFEHVEPTEPSP